MEAEGHVTAPQRTPRPQMIVGSAFIEALLSHGVIRPEDRASRVVIVAEAGRSARLYVERVGDERLLDLAAFLRAEC